MFNLNSNKARFACPTWFGAAMPRNAAGHADGGAQRTARPTRRLSPLCMCHEICGLGLSGPMRSHRRNLPSSKSASWTISAVCDAAQSAMPKRLTSVSNVRSSPRCENPASSMSNGSARGCLEGWAPKIKRAFGSMNLWMSRAEPVRSMPACSSTGFERGRTAARFGASALRS